MNELDFQKLRGRMTEVVQGGDLLDKIQCAKGSVLPSVFNRRYYNEDFGVCFIPRYCNMKDGDLENFYELSAYGEDGYPKSLMKDKTFYEIGKIRQGLWYRLEDGIPAELQEVTQLIANRKYDNIYFLFCGNRYDIDSSEFKISSVNDKRLKTQREITLDMIANAQWYIEKGF